MLVRGVSSDYQKLISLLDGGGTHTHLLGLLARMKMAKIPVTHDLWIIIASGGLDRHARDFDIYNRSPGLLRLTHRGIRCYLSLFELHICISCNLFIGGCLD